jgi:DNA-binding GntR family transcriptional regulator
VPACPYHEHSDLVDAIEARDAERAAALMVDHLQHVEAALDFQRSGDGEIDFDAVFS